jgi:hypothetical protein
MQRHDAVDVWRPALPGRGVVEVRAYESGNIADSVLYQVSRKHATDD